jgi:hypothetical protein
MTWWPGLAAVAWKFWETTAEMAPYLLLGFALAGVLSVAVRPESVERHLSGRGIWPVIKATLFGIPLPLCSCGVIPVAASLRRHGAGRGATAAFLISTPQTGVDSITVTYSLLGPLVALLRPLAALLTGMAGGYAIQSWGGPAEERAAPSADSPPACADACCAPGAARPWPLRMLHYGLVALPRDIGGAVLGGLMAAGLIGALVPDDFFAQYLGNRWAAMAVMLVVGTPLYVCATGSVPIAAALVAKGISPGAALVFLMAGPATNAAAIAALWRVLGRRSALIYLAVVGLGAILFGVLLDSALPGAAARIPIAHHHHPQGIPLWKSACAAGLLALLAWAVASRLPWRRRASVVAALGGPADAVFRVSGMTCSSCRESVEEAIRSCPGVTAAAVDLASGAALVRGAGFDRALLAQRVRDRGFEIAEGGAP